VPLVRFISRPLVAAPLTWWESVLHALWIFLPAYVANMAPVFVAKVFPRWGAPIDGGRVAKDGRRLLGAGKTWRGLAGGVVLAGATAIGLALWAPHWDLMHGWDYGHGGYWGQGIGEPFRCSAPADAPCDPGTPRSAPAAAVFLFGAAMGFFALLGDAVKSYFKRRVGKEGGAPWVPFDQLDFVVFGLLGMLAASPLLPTGWVWHALTDDWLVPATLLVLTPLLHLLVNRIGYRLRLKSVPW
jgi:CDP-2,3-bis-(O-geranylgeranyl)-sn-glycerol synthase